MSSAPDQTGGSGAGAGGVALSIPGKVMLSGEYAVLYGGTAALVQARQQLHARQVGLADEGAYPPVARAARRIRIRELEDYERAHGLPHFSLDHGEFFAEDGDGCSAKLGLGLSAAEAVAAVALRYNVAGLDWAQHRAEVLQYALASHREVSGGGSGADVAACASAAPVLCALVDGELQVRPLPPDAVPVVPLALYWSGVPADTRELVALFQRWVRGEARSVDHPLPGDNDPLVRAEQEQLARDAARAGLPLPADAAEAPALLAKLLHASDALAPAWFSAPPAELFALIDRFDAAMSNCSAAAGLPYALPVHTRLSAWARRHGGRAKPTGAGGGDMLLLIGDLPLSQLQGLVLPLS